MNPKNQVRLDENLQRLMKQHDYSLHQLAKDLNINKSTIHNYMNGVIPQGVHALIKISHLFKMPVDELLFGHPDPSSPAPASPRSLSEQFLELLEKENKEGSYEIIIRKMK